MMKQEMAEAINDQINAEWYSSFLYMSMAAYFEDQALGGMASWMRMQAKEEEFHAMKFFDYLVERGARVELKAIEEPPKEWDSPLAVFESAYEHEVKVTGLINRLMTMAIKLEDYATQQFLQWYVEEQVEEEDSTSTAVDKLKLIERSAGGLFMLDKELGARTFAEPPAEGE